MSSGDACFNFYLQTFKDFERTPIEQSAVEWKEDAAPPVLVTKITIPAQQFDSHGQTTFCENLSYTPWHVLPEHKPLGAVNRARRVVYTVVSKLRHGLNEAFRSEAYRRARQTAELAGFCASAESDLDLMEWDYGDYEGRRTVDIRSARPGWVLFEDGCPGGETRVDMATRADRVIARVRALKNDVLVFAHRDILRILIARWMALPALEARRLDLATASVGTLGYDHGLDEPVIRRLNDA